MSSHAAVPGGGAAERQVESRAPSFVVHVLGVLSNLRAAFWSMLLYATHVFCVLTPCTLDPECHLNNVNSVTAGPERCLVYGVEQCYP